MESLKATEVVSTFRSAKNINAAVKNFLRKEVQGNQRSERFAKSFRDAVLAKKPEIFERFVDQQLADQEIFFLALARHAYSEELGTALQRVAEQYADDFNATYESNGEDEIKITDQAKFKQILIDVKKGMSQLFSELGVPENGFTQKTLFITLLEPGVFQKAQEYI